MGYIGSANDHMHEEEVKSLHHPQSRLVEILPIQQVK
jgi:hypothetical protein